MLGFHQLAVYCFLGAPNRPQSRPQATADAMVNRSANLQTPRTSVIVEPVSPSTLSGMINCIETEVETPLCPHCEKPLRELLSRKLKSFFGVRYVYFCPQCKKTLGITHRKGFWMG
jgi:hypothetical protein